MHVVDPDMCALYCDHLTRGAEQPTNLGIHIFAHVKSDYGVVTNMILKHCTNI